LKNLGNSLFIYSILGYKGNSSIVHEIRKDECVEEEVMQYQEDEEEGKRPLSSQKSRYERELKMKALIKHKMIFQTKGSGVVKQFILQKYIEKPLLFKKRKFDIRV